MSARAAGFISFEGGEGAGKTTQILGLAEALRATGTEVVTTREPGGSPSAEAVRALLIDPARSWEPLSEALLHAAARGEHLRQTIRPALARGAWVLCDRFADSTVAYQGYGQGVPAALIDRLNADVVGETWPRLTLILDIPAEEGLARTHRRGQVADRYEAMDTAFHERLRAGFLAVARAAPDRCVVIDARPDARTVQTAIRAAIRERLGLAL